MKLSIGCKVFYQSALYCGTAGAFVIEPNSQRIGLLSCHHVIASGNKKPGDLIHTQIQNHQGFTKVPIAQLGPSIFNRHADAAVAWLIDSVTPCHRKALPNVFSTKTRDPVVGDVLTKVGDASGCSRGLVTAIKPYPTRYGRQVVEKYAMYIEPLSDEADQKVLCQPGDSGAVWYDENTGEAVGIHFAGESNSAYGPLHAKACFITQALEQFKLELYLPPTIKR